MARFYIQAVRSWLRDHFFKKRKERKERESAFVENGSKLLEKLIASCNGRSIPIRNFSAQQLHLATNNYCEPHLEYWYKGSLEGRIVLVNRLSDAKILAYLTINDIVISAQMSGHSNVLKPIGCCLDTPCPILVYEFAANGILADRIYVSRVTELRHQPMVWERRLKIARQIAHAISYLHTAFERPVIHMYIHMRSILLDEPDVPKLSTFLFSVSIPEGETDVKGYQGFRKTRFCAPEFRRSGKVTEKTDVYYFGELLLELLTGEDSSNITRLKIDDGSILVQYIHNRAQGFCINEIVDPTILADGEGGASLQRQLQAVLDLALICTEKDPHRRPTMVDVTKQLRRIERFTEVGEELLGSLQNLKLHQRYEMLLWKIANDILLTEAQKKQKCEIETTCCPLCDIENETCLHLFKNCSVVKAAWFSSNWGFCIESLNVNNSFDLIKNIVVPPAHVLHEQVTKEQFVLMAAKIMDYIWRLRNRVMFQNEKVNFQAIPFEISRKLEEHASASLKRNASNDESQAVKEACEKPPEA
ncbi:serine/threonine-protein kinase ZRK1-like isoform X1 [Quercus robur]|uniref:serine/threonine-protein kinase ZRK1-like isoform X1 n=1 Tax=Quercus robur TaxID=38942 RepID=UPI0021613204|nr:serine/threonine-protein kinase ZRK1-like isoform X1 [Quercus robur]